jgi:hypothetical protein
VSKAIIYASISIVLAFLTFAWSITEPGCFSNVMGFYTYPKESIISGIISTPLAFSSIKELLKIEIPPLKNEFGIQNLAYVELIDG